MFVHAGVNLLLKDWKNSNTNDFRWIRNPFIYEKNDTGKIIVFGHTPTMFIRSEMKSDIWISPCKTKIGIDGGAIYGGMLHGLRINYDMPYEVVSVDSFHFVHINQYPSFTKSCM